MYGDTICQITMERILSISIGIKRPPIADLLGDQVKCNAFGTIELRFSPLAGRFPPPMELRRI
jgi:hypothetical protein